MKLQIKFATELHSGFDSNLESARILTAHKITVPRFC